MVIWPRERAWGLGRVSAERSEPPKAGATRGAKCAERSEGSRADRVAGERTSGNAAKWAPAAARGRGSFAASSLPSTGRASVRDPSPSAGQGVRRGARICRAQTACLIAAVYKVRVLALPRTRQNCSARQFLEVSSKSHSRTPPRTRRAPRHHQSGAVAPPRPAGANCRETGRVSPRPRLKGKARSI